MVVEVFKGRGVKSKYGINQDLVDQYSGQLKHLQDLNIHRLIVNLLIKGILEELFISTKLSNTNSNTSVYLILGKKHDDILKGRSIVEMSDGVTSARFKQNEIQNLVHSQQHAAIVMSQHTKNTMIAEKFSQERSFEDAFKKLQSIDESTLRFINGGGQSS